MSHGIEPFMRRALAEEVRLFEAKERAEARKCEKREARRQAQQRAECELQAELERPLIARSAREQGFARTNGKGGSEVSVHSQVTDIAVTKTRNQGCPRTS